MLLYFCTTPVPPPPLAISHHLQSPTHYFKSITCVYSVMLSLQRRCMGVLCCYFRPKMFPPGDRVRYIYHSRMVCFLGTGLHSCASLFLKIRNPKSQSTNLAGSLDGAPIITQSRRHKPCSKIDVSYSAHSQLAFDASLLFTDCQRDCDCDLRFARCCAAAVRSHNTTPPLRPRRGLTHLGGRHNVEYRAGPEEKKFGPRHVLATEA